MLLVNIDVSTVEFIAHYWFRGTGERQKKNEEIAKKNEFISVDIANILQNALLIQHEHTIERHTQHNCHTENKKGVLEEHSSVEKSERERENP